MGMNRPLRVLIVEDSDPMATFLVTALPATDTKVTAIRVSSLTEALLRIRSERFDVVLLDLLLPDAADVQAIEKIQELAPELPLVVISGMGDVLEEKAMLAGADSYIAKGDDVSPALMIRSLRHAVIRNEVNQRFRRAYESLDASKKVLEQCKELERQVNAKLHE